MKKEEFEEYIIEVTWEIEDGYVDSRPQKLRFKPSIDMSVGEWNEMSYEDKVLYVKRLTQDDFEDRISWYISTHNIK